MLVDILLSGFLLLCALISAVSLMSGPRQLPGTEAPRRPSTGTR